MTYTRAMQLDELWSGEMQGRVVDGIRVLFIRSGDTVLAYADRCAHLGVELSRGTLSGNTLTCSAHHWEYDVQSGQGINPRTACLARFPVKVESGEVWIDLGEPR